MEKQLDKELTMDLASMLVFANIKTGSSESPETSHLIILHEALALYQSRS